jgi:hypothetical protein
MQFHGHASLSNGKLTFTFKYTVECQSFQTTIFCNDVADTARFILYKALYVAAAVEIIAVFLALISRDISILFQKIRLTVGVNIFTSVIAKEGHQAPSPIEMTKSPVFEEESPSAGAQWALTAYIPLR